MFTEISGDNGLSDKYESLKRGYCERGRRANCGIQAAAFPSPPRLVLVHAGKDPSEARDRTEYFCLDLSLDLSRDSLRARPAPPPPAEAAARCRQAKRTHCCTLHLLYGVAYLDASVPQWQSTGIEGSSSPTKDGGVLRAETCPLSLLETSLAALLEGIKVGAMETSGSDAAVTYLEKAVERDGYYDLEHLPPLLEDEENVSLADILSLRDSCLSEEEMWAVCAECVVALQSIRPTHLFYTLCITPDTLAFNAHGNVCFMEQLSDDPDCSFVPPEFDNMGSTFEGHIYSLGSTISAALNFVIEPELEAELGEEFQNLLQQMQEEKPEDRPELEDILLLAEEQLSHTSSAAVCRKLSSMGRRVLSIESVSNIQDEQEESWEARWQYSKARCHLKRLNSEDKTKDLSDTFVANSVSRQQVCGTWDSSLWAEDMESDEADTMVLTDEIDCRSYNSSPVKRRSQQKVRGARGALNRSCSVPDSNNPPCVSTSPHGDISIPVSDLTEIGADEHLGSGSVWSNRLQRLNRGKSCESYPHSRTQDQEKASQGNDNLDCCTEENNYQDSGKTMSRGSIQDFVSSCTSCCKLEIVQNSSEDEGITKPNLSISYNYMTKSMLCLNEESQDEWISLRELLIHCGRRLTVNELWALCYTCLSSLQTYTDFPAYLCLDTVYVNCKGEVIFLKPKTIESHDGFFLAPEYQEHGIVTEKVCLSELLFLSCKLTSKVRLIFVFNIYLYPVSAQVCVYGVAAILWASAKFSLSPNQKLVMPRKMKRLLLEMAKRTPMERPTIATAKKSCLCNLSLQGISPETVWGNLISRVHPPASKGHDAEDLIESDNHQCSTDEPQKNSGFVPMATESRLAPVPGPVPHSYPVNMELQLPEAFISTATHFTPIILTNEREMEEQESQHLGTVTIGTAHRLTRNSAHDMECCLDAPQHQHQSPSKANRHSQKLTDCHTVMSTSSKTSSSIPEDSPSVLSDVSLFEVSLPSLSSPLSTNLNSCGIFNNYLFWQDPMTECLSLVPVKVRAPKSLNRLDITPSLIPQSLRGLITGQMSNGGLFIDPVSGTVRSGTQDLFYLSGSSDSSLDHASHQACCGQTDTKTQGEKEALFRDQPALQDVIDLLKGQFSTTGCLDNGCQDIIMGKYLFTLKGLQCQQFASVVKKRFCDLHWEDDLLGVLHCLVNYSCSTLTPCRDCNEYSPSKAVKRAAFTTAACRGKTEVCLRSCLDLNGNIHTSRPVAVGVWEGTEALTFCGEDGKALDGAEIRLEKSWHWISQGGKTNSLESGVMEAGGHSVGGSDESPYEAEFLSGREEDLMGTHDELMSPDCSEDMEDSDSLVSERLLSPTSRTACIGLSFSPAWSLALFGEDCFGQEVIEYALNLGKHTGSPGLEVKVQEVQQQLVIETRNLKKTRSFYQKLKNQQERKNKGPESKLMLSKLKSQLEELRSKVAFLDCVKKYLEVLCVDQWGLEVSLLPSLAVCGCHSLNLQSTEDPTVLSFGTTKGKRTLQTGSPLGLMAFLYARNAAAEGYIQQFLYTYRFFCTPEQLLQFIMDKFISAAREGPPMSGDSQRIFRRSLDLLQIWMTDCKSVDFTPKSSLVDTLETFLNTEVIPVDNQGEALLAILYSHPNTTTLSQVTGNLTSLDEEDDSVCLHSSNEDLSKKWKISRVVEPPPSMSKEKVFSIAAALPAPCYGSLMYDFSNTCMQSEERLPFSQKEHSALHIAQQLTLLEQEVFHGCHPVHFLKSRTQGVKDKLCSPNKNVSQLFPPSEGSSGLGHEGTPSDSFLQQLLTYAESVTNWISAEIVICDSAKTQIALLTRYLWIGKYCYEMRNFATAMQVLRGLENVIVRQLPAWKHLTSKVYEILEELRAVEVFLKSDDLCLMGAEHKRTRPTLPSIHILAMHVQQLEIGAFTLTTGAYKWTKLRC
ncbi:kinase non-catalytic C-lobe domain-containing protein 1 isoform X4 [Girardinichthys multiradiatus]|uniref:kinase non-catalytic C-lobe domain-containing protein 1 isoform X4 n=1 Tax=Girardinichthys multiradiatus TaxID=208333 RepID=UPI001FABA123|nr:kinase non-catalytic C-lobe domain-containing protein 1 isoform X4 [Girardinichthys multiradiatus]